MSQDELRRLLAGAVPEAPARVDRAEAARTWARRRRNKFVAGASMAVVAMAIGIPVVLAHGSDRRVEPAPEVKEFNCPTEQAPPTVLPSAGSTPGRLSENPVAVRLCNQFRGGAPGSLGSYQVPVDALVGSAAESLAASVIAVGPQPKNGFCDLMFAPSYYFVFSYPDGHTENVTATAGNCSGGVVVGTGQVRGDGEDALAIFRKFNTALLAQRTGEEPPARAQSELRCGGRGGGFSRNGAMSPLKTTGLPELTRAVLCWDSNRFSPQPTQEAEFSADDLKQVLESMNRDSRAPTSHPAVSCEQGSVNYQIVGENAWGDRYTLDGSCGDFNLRSYGDLLHWQPRGLIARIFARMLATGTDRLVLPSPTTSPDDVLFTWADLVNTGDERADDLWVGGRPSGVSDHRPVFISPGKGDVLPNGQRPASVSGYAQALEIDAIWGDSTSTCPAYRAKTFILVRQSDDEAWRILSWADHGAYSHGLGC